jgi:transcriptional regulator with XRE-family HTH domain
MSALDHEIRATFGRACRETRLALDLTQQQVADASGIARSFIAKLERGGANPTLATVAAVAAALGLELELAIRRPMIVGTPRRGDLVHARCSGYVDRRLTRAGWMTAREVEIAHARTHGWIDLLAFDPRAQTVLVIEIKTRLDDLGALERQIRWYEREARFVARQMGWRPHTVLVWVLVLASHEVDAAIVIQRDALASSFPVRAPAMLERLEASTDAGAEGWGLALIDPRSRRKGWLIRTRIDGRRSPAPYAGYADAARRIGG